MNPSVKLFLIDRRGSLGLLLLLVIDRVMRTLMITSDDYVSHRYIHRRDYYC